MYTLPGERGNRFSWHFYRYYETKPAKVDPGHSWTERDGSSDWEVFKLQERPVKQPLNDGAQKRKRESDSGVTQEKKREKIGHTAP